MASPSLLISFIALIALALHGQVTLGAAVTCEKLDQSACAFAVSSSGTRCVLEKHVTRSGLEVFECRTSEIEADISLKDYVESEECIKACGVDRNSLGISSDSLLDSRFTQKLCSPPCYTGCPNIVDLYFNLAAGGRGDIRLCAFLPKLCENQKGENARREMSEIKSSGNVVAPGPLSALSASLYDAGAPVGEPVLAPYNY
ncbi:hypothetical protein Scep_006289 [Stephania cephalantha]|uniref:PAR1 protein n=1 Tax=Stephania cephalantha TaxID=152367 RepID=A0AAP0PKP2_9MAGN